MTIKAKLLFILIGDNATGKTTIQKMLIEKITDKGWYEKLPCNLLCNIVHPEIKRKYKSISFANRSYQEKIEEYKSVEEYFENHFSDADIAFISTHLIVSHISQMIEYSRRWYYNVNAIFLSNSISANNSINSQISLLNWDERFIVENPITENWESQLNAIAENIVTLIVNRTSIS